MHTPEAPSLTSALFLRMAQACADANGWLPFDRFMALALYEPGLGYYANDRPKLGHMPQAQGAGGAVVEGSDFVTAPELSPLFGQAVAHQVVDALHATGTREVWEFGAGTGALALQILEQTNEYHKAPGGYLIQKYTIVDLSGSLRERQRHTLRGFGGQVVWADRLPEQLHGVVLGNEVLDAMPVKLLARRGGEWFERGVALAEGATGWAWQDRPTSLRPPVDVPGDHDYTTEIHPQAEAFLRTLADRLVRGSAFFIDYGFPEAEFFHPQRDTGTLACHHLHRMDADPLVRVGEKDITAHVNFTGAALAAQEAGLDVLGYTTQARFLFNCGLGPLLDALPHDNTGVAQRAMASKLVNEHEMGELFKVLALAPAGQAQGWVPVGFTAGDRTHTL
jgi:SAM-dependent MidA family methyltransferase